jgi:methyl-accepting chemotaxis protein
LAKERHLLNTVINTLPDLIYVKDTQSRFMLGNAAVARLILGTPTPDALLGKTDFDFFAHDLASKYYADEQALVRSGQPLLNCEEPTVDAEGNKKWLSTTKVPFRDSQGQVMGFVGVGRDITAIKQVEEAMIADVAMLTQAAVAGKLAVRADPSKHSGKFRNIVQGFNDTLDAVIGPLNMVAHYLNRIAKGDIPPKIADEYKGDFNELKNNLNACIDAVNALVADTNMLAQAAIEGRLTTRAEASKHQSDFRQIVEGVNATLDAVIALMIPSRCWHRWRGAT